jgi:serine O-acetyltransferase
MVGIPARPVGRRSDPKQTEPAFQPYAVCGDIPDPIARALSGLLDEVTSLRARITELEQERAVQGPALDPASGEQRPLRLVASSGGNGTDSD